MSNSLPVVLTIAGSDSCAGAGIQADLKTIAALGGYGVSAISALTAQNTRGVQAAQAVAPDFVRAQLRSLFADLPIRAVKSGMLGGREVVRVVAALMREQAPAHFVLDPVGRATSGDSLLDAAGLAALADELLPLATVVTPNGHEAAALTGLPVTTAAEAAVAARALLNRGARAVVVTGGDLRSDRAIDVLVTAAGEQRFEGERLASRHTHGTGCTFSAAIATLLAQGHALAQAVAQAKQYVTLAIGAAPGLGAGHGPTDHFFFLRQAGAGWVPTAAPAPRPLPRLHVITDEQQQARYTHVELARLAAEGGADAVQLREKRPRATRELIALAQAMRAELAPRQLPLVVDDRLDVALAAQAEGLHVGRDDPEPALVRRLLGGAAWVGATANSLEEARALAQAPVDYLGVGPVFETHSKARPAATLGLDGLAAIVAAVDKPVIAIGGITAERVAGVLEAGAWGVAATAAVVCQPDPAAATRRLREAIEAFDLRSSG
ncbi:MAG: bifunctional hydroxymethylpyrimidine kinase/phosphomethylpyrimidine kinase [Proteobacteria bacterium]|nr:bifunctional hydroxymethylpyrimidine kinase/phosphomethylpyrimidine kinase [Pseudomonadota bacterium]